MNWHKLKPLHIFREPVEYIHSASIFDQKEYDHLYENSNDLNHQVWKEFDSKFKTGFEWKDDITDIDFNKEVIALWFFKERSDQYAQPRIDLKGKHITYFPNAFLLTKCKEIKIIEPKKKYIRRPMIQLDISTKIFDNIIERF